MPSGAEDVGVFVRVNHHRAACQYGTTARANSGAVSMELSTWKWPSIKLGGEIRPAEVDNRRAW